MPQGQGGGGDGGGAISDQTSVLNQILQELQKLVEPGQAKPFTDYLTVTTAGTFQALYQNQKFVRHAIIENLSSTDTLTITAKTGSANGPGGTSGKGIVLNPAGSSGQGGGNVVFGNVDLSQYFITCSTNNTQAFSVYGEV